MTRSHHLLAALAAVALFLSALPAPAPAQHEGGLAGRLADRLEEAPPAPEPIERPFLWRIERTPPSFLYGTVHISDPRVTTLPDVVSAAIDAADALYTEIPMDLATQMGALEKMRDASLPPLDRRFSPEVHAKLRAALADRGLPQEMFATMTFTGVFLTISTIDMAGEIMRHGAPLDMRLANLAASAGKITGGLEDIEHQTQALEGFTFDEQNELMSDMLDNLHKAAEMYHRMIDVYVSGDEEQMIALMREEWDEENPLDAKLAERLLYRRNRVMADRIEELMAAAPDDVFFFAVGAAHNPGAQGVIELLEQRGWTLTRLARGDAAIPAEAELVGSATGAAPLATAAE